MQFLIIFLMIFFTVSFAHADVRVVVEKSTGRIIEMQSHARPGTLIENAKNAGFPAADVEERVMTEADYKAAMLAQDPPPPREPSEAEVIKRALQNKGAVTPADLNTARGQLRGELNP